MCHVVRTMLRKQMNKKPPNLRSVDLCGNCLHAEGSTYWQRACLKYPHALVSYGTVCDDHERLDVYNIEKVIARNYQANA